MAAGHGWAAAHLGAPTPSSDCDTPGAGPDRGDTGEIQGTTGEQSLAMEDIFHFIREGNAMQVRMWLDDTEHDMNQG